MNSKLHGLVILVAALLCFIIFALFLFERSEGTHKPQLANKLLSSHEKFNVLKYLLQKADPSTIAINSSAKHTVVEFSVPKGYAIWPNNIAPYDSNAMRISWHKEGDVAHRVLIHSASSHDLIDVSKPIDLFEDPNNKVLGMYLIPEAEGHHFIMKTRKFDNRMRSQSDNLYEAYVAGPAAAARKH